MTLGLIWNLADRQQRGALGVAEFVVAMHLINCTKNGTLPVLPQVLPPGLYDVASGRVPAARPPPDRRPPPRGFSPGAPAVPPIPKQFSGNQVRAQSPLSRQYTPPMTIPPQPSGGDWAVSAREKAEFDSLFNQVDKEGKGFITGEEAVPFFSNSKLPEDVLAQIWDLADIKKMGRLTRDEFAIAMHLIRQQRSRRETGGPGLPDVLPSNLIPPSMRSSLPTVPPASVFEAPPPPLPKPSEDLFGLSEAFGAPASTVPPTATSPTFSPFESNTSVSPSHTGVGGTNFFAPAGIRQFVPQSSFGQQIQSSVTGGTQVSQRSNVDDLLGDTDPEISKKLTSESTEIANLSNQVNSLTKQTQELQAKRLSSEQDLSVVNAQKQDIQGQLSRLRGLYEREAAEVQRIHDQLAASRAETAKLRNEYALVQTQYQDLQGRRQELAFALENDKRENLQLKEQVARITAENKSLTQQLEKLRIDGKQQKGLVTITKKQLSTAEQERDKIKGEIEEARNTSSPAPGSPTPSHASTVQSQTNPFAPGYRRSPPAAPESAFSPGQFSPPAPQHNSRIDDVFSPAFANVRSSPAPQTSFGGKLQESPFPAPEVESRPTSPPTFQGYADNNVLQQQVQAQQAQQAGAVSRPDTPTNWVTASAENKDFFGNVQSPAQKARRASMSVKSDAGTEASARVTHSRQEEQKPSFPFDKLEKNTTGSTTGGGLEKKRDSFSSYGQVGSSVGGAFSNSDVHSPIKQNPTGDSTISRASNKPDPFHLLAPKEESKAGSSEFDKAFANLNLVPKAAERHNTGSSAMSASKFNTEFPPIDINEDDGSDTESDRGFDDNFTQPAPAAASTMPAVTAPPPASPPKDDKDQNAPIPAPQANLQSSNIFGQQSENPFPALDKSDTFPQASNQQTSIFGNPKASTHNTGSSLFSAPSAAPSAGSTLFPTPSAPKPTVPAKEPLSATDDQFDDDAFADLADAKEEDSKTDDNDYSIVGGNDFTDFDSVFDSPASNRGAGARATAPEFDFGFGTTQQPAVATTQIWDEIFADFGGSETAGAPGAPAGQPAPGQQQPQQSEKIIPGPPLSRQQTNNGGNELGGTPAQGEATGEKKLKAEDEAKLTSLQSMGFTRDKALRALESQKWNLEQVCVLLVPS